MTTSDELEEELDLPAIADQLAELSRCEIAPVGVEVSGEVRADEVDWKANGWLATVQQVAGWLNLPNASVRDGEPSVMAADLFSQLGENAPSACTEDVGGSLCLTRRGHSLLEAALQRAINLKRKFEEDIDSGASLADASRRWSEASEEAVAEEEHRPVQVNAIVTAWKIKEFRDNAQEGKLELNPSYQRDIVWSNSDSQRLIDSVLRGIPLPSIILNQRRNSGQLEIVDGKQRLTAILRFIGEHPAGKRYAEEKSTSSCPASRSTRTSPRTPSSCSHAPCPPCRATRISAAQRARLWSRRSSCGQQARRFRTFERTCSCAVLGGEARSRSRSKVAFPRGCVNPA